MLIEHLKVPLAFVNFNAALVGSVHSSVFVINSRVPFLEEVVHHTNLIVLFCSRLASLVLELRSLY